MFENGASKQSKINNKKEKYFAPPKPPRLAATETNPEEGLPVDEQQATKRRAPSPPKEKNGTNGEIKSNSKAVEDNSTYVSKRKAPEPPTSSQVDKSKINTETSESCKQGDAKVRNASSRGSSIEEDGDVNAAPIPAKRERKGSVDSLEDINSIKQDQPTPTPRRKVQNSCEATNITQEEKINGSVKKPKKAETTVTIVATPISSNERSKPQEEPCVIQACVVEAINTPEDTVRSVSSENTVTVKAVSCGGSKVKSKTHKSERMKVTTVDETEKRSRKVTGPEKISDGNNATAAAERKPSSSSRKTRESTKKEDFAFKVPMKPAPARENCHFDLNETVNLNDVNIHEMTFTFDFGQFEQELEKERESMFVSYEEKCKQVHCLLFFRPVINFLASCAGILWACHTSPPPPPPHERLLKRTVTSMPHLPNF